MQGEKYDIAPYRDISDDSGVLRVHAIAPYTRVHGPVESYSIWLQGCLKRCPGCSNQDMLPLEREGLDLIPPRDIVEDIQRRQSTVTQAGNVTIHGGEPMIQARNLAHFLELLKEALPTISVTLFTGYLYENLKLMAQTNHAVAKILDHFDVLIDGPFEKESRDNDRIAGSKNQKIYQPVNRFEESSLERRGRQIIFNASGGIKVSTGICLK